MAVDVCDLCYGDLCRSCALPLKGRKDRVCKDCALTVSGVRGSGKTEVRGDRRTVKSRRKAYAAIEQPDDYFQFFDADLPADALTAGHPPPPASRSDRERAAAAGSASAIADGSPATAGDGTGIRRLLGRLKSNEPYPADGELLPIDEILADKTPDADDDETGVAKDADAVSQLADIRRRDRNAADDGPEFAPSETDQVGGPATDGGDAAGPVGEERLPADSSVAIPSTLLRGFPDSHADGPNDPDDSAPLSAPESLSGIAAPDDAFSGPRQDPFASSGEDVVSKIDGRPFPGHEQHAESESARPAGHDVEGDDPGEWTSPSDDDRSEFAVDPFESRPGHVEPAFQPERRRTIEPTGEFPSAVDEHEISTARPISQLNDLDVSPRLRDLMADLSDQPPSSSTTENPFLKRSRVVSDPDAAPDFSTDPFSAIERLGPHPTTTSNATRSPVPAPVSRSSSPPAIGSPKRSHPDSPAQFDPPDNAGDDHFHEELEPAAHLAAASTASDAETPDPEGSDTATPPSRPPIAAYTPAERHPLAAFADSDRHPLAAFARSTTSPPPTTSTPKAPEPPPALRPSSNPQPSSDPQPPPIDDVFPSEAAYPAVDRTAGGPPAVDDVPSIDDVLPLESTEAEVASEPTDAGVIWEQTEPDPPIDALATWQTWMPPELSEPQEQTEPDEPTEPREPAEPDEPTEVQEPSAPSTSWQTWIPPGPGEPQEPTEPDEPAESSTSWQTWIPPEPGEPQEPIGPDEPTEPSTSWHTWIPPERSESWETWEPSHAEPTEEPSEIPALGSTVLRTVDEDSAEWTAVEDVPDLDGRTPRQRADTDARGSWIPPALRGIAPDAKEAAEDLPRRRQ